MIKLFNSSNLEASSPVRKNIDEVITEVVVEEIYDEKELLHVYSQESDKSSEKESSNSPNQQKHTKKPATQYNPFLKKSAPIETKESEIIKVEKAARIPAQKGKIPSEMFAKYPSDKELKLKETQPVEPKQIITEISEVSEAPAKDVVDSKIKENLNTATTDYEEEKVEV